MNRRIVIFETDSTNREKIRAALSPLVQAHSSFGNEAIASQPDPEAYRFLYSNTLPDLLVSLRDSLSKEAPFAGCLVGPSLQSHHVIETIKSAHQIDQNLQFLFSGTIEESTKAELNQIFGSEHGQLWDVLNEAMSPLSLKHKLEILTCRWEREHLLTRQLIRSERIASVGMLAAGIGHEVGNILLRIVGKAEVALAKKDTKEYEDTLRIIINAAIRGGEIIRSLQSASKKQDTLYHGTIQSSIQDSLNLIIHEFKEAGIEVKESYEETPTVLDYNRAELAQVFLNLFVNARHAMELSGGKLSIETRALANGCETLVRDSGCGIHPDQINRIFESQFTTKGDKGNGFGLSISKAIVEKHGGTLTVTSELGKGTEFRIFLPKETK